MGYLHIPNLYKAQEILLFRRCYAMEKIHGTSAHIAWKDGNVRFMSGGESHEKFCALFNADALAILFQEKFGAENGVIVFGEAYGGKCQGMSKTYGPKLAFVAFDVKVGEHWLSVPQAADVASSLALDFVFYEEVDTDLMTLNSTRDADSIQAIKNGMGIGRMREGVVLRPLVELRMNNGNRIIAKHKREEFSERASIPEVDPTRREILEQASAVADEWVTDMRLNHVLDTIATARGGEQRWDIADTGDVIKAMVEDVCREASGEIADNKGVRKAIGGKAAQMFKRKLQGALDANLPV